MQLKKKLTFPIHCRVLLQESFSNKIIFQEFQLKNNNYTS